MANPRSAYASGKDLRTGDDFVNVRHPSWEYNLGLTDRKNKLIIRMLLEVYVAWELFSTKRASIAMV